MKNKIVFLTGSKGFIGRNLMESLSKDNLLIEYDRNYEIQEQLLFSKPDVIINSAAEIYKPELMFNSNIVLVQKILEYVRQNKTEHFIQFGSSSEYGKKDRPMSEFDSLNPRNLYEGTKAAATMLCMSYSKCYDLQITIIRPFSVYGKHEKEHRLFPKLAKSFLHGQKMTLNNGYHDFIYIKDFINGVMTILNSPKEKTKGDIVNLGYGKQYSNGEVLRIFEGVLKKTGLVEIDASFAKDFETENWICDTSYVKKRYGFEAKFDLEQGVRDYLNEITL